MSKSPYKPRRPLSLEDAALRTIGDLGGLSDVAALPGVRVSRGILQKYTDDSEEHERHKMPMDIAAVITAETVRRGGEPHLLMWLEEHVNRDVPHVDMEKCLFTLASRLSKESADVFKDIAEVLDPKGPGGRNLTPRERAKLIGDLLDLQRLSRGAIAMLERGE